MAGIFLLQLFVELVTFFISLALLRSFLKRFKVEKLALSFALFSLFVFVLGFALRLNGNDDIIDTGFFLTEYSVLFTTLFMALSFLLGQIKYWKIKFE
jgi:hypothetical protein